MKLRLRCPDCKRGRLRHATPAPVPGTVRPKQLPVKVYCPRCEFSVLRPRPEAGERITLE